LIHSVCNVFDNSNINENEISPNSGGLKQLKCQKCYGKLTKTIAIF